MVSELDPTRPHPATLLGVDLVLWRDGGGDWRAFRDACPHRLAPLSQVGMAGGRGKKTKAENPCLIRA